MLKRNLCKKVLSAVLAVTLVMTSALAGIVAAPMSAEAAASYENANLLVNPDFEESKAFSPAGGSHAGNWFYWQNASKATGNAQSGNGYVKFTGSDSALEQDIESSDLIPGMTYIYSVWAKLSGTTTAEHIIGVKNYGGAEMKQQVDSTEWKKYEIEFVYISGNPRVYGYVGTHAGVDMYIDNASVTVKSDVETVSIKNGEMTVKFVDSYTGIPTVEDLTANYTVAQSSASGKLVWTDSSWDPQTNTAVLKFLEIPAKAVEQNVTVNLTYAGATIALDFVVEANGEEVVTAKMTSVTAENGQLTIALDKEPTVEPKEADFGFEYKIGDESYKALTVESFAYNAEDLGVSVTFAAMKGREAKDVTVKVTYQNASLEDSFALEVTEASTYYVDSTNGNDANDGLSPEKAFASIDKLNTIVFQPGDEILFKNGETFVGCFKPQGSGTEAAPIKIAAYGDSEKRAVLQPGEDWQVSHIMSADAMHPGVGGTTTSPYVNYVIQFYNVAYWEVSDLEIMDPTPQTKNDFTATYCSGITIQGEDIGVLEHFYIDNVIIHGFHGPGTNLGKTSGGITMNVITNKEWNRSKSVPTQINDIRITNCEIYDVGRSGINFLTPWAYRSEGKWAGSYGTGRASYEYLPYEDFYLGNNYIHDIDGDGCIIDNCANAVVENNLVTRCVTRLHSSAPMAVGLFNWNSDDTYFQFNEVYDIQIGGTEAYNDGQGIEIDALNDRTWVQYNYVHDNRGGFMMFCTIGDAIRGYDYVVRYNISQNDYAHPRQGIIDIYTDSHNAEVYNNTLYLTERALKGNQIFLFATAQSPGANATKFYNNIFYYDGAAPAAATQFGDGAIDWQSNIFYGFTNLPQNDNPSAPNLSVDPMLADPGKGGTGSWNNGVITKVDLSCYKLLDGSPAINAGMPLENNGGRDYFGNDVIGIPDIGAYESGAVALKIVSVDDTVVVLEDTIKVVDTDNVTVAKLLDALVHDMGVVVEVKGAADEVLKDGDVVTVKLGNDKLTYKVVVEENPEGRDYPVDKMTAISDSQYLPGTSNEGPDDFILDGNANTHWHTNWATNEGTDVNKRWIGVSLEEAALVDGIRYLPRNSGGNGAVTEYEVQYRETDNGEWKTVATGTWSKDDKNWQLVSFEAVTAKQVRVVGIHTYADSGNDAHMSTAEFRVSVAKEEPTPEVTPTPDPTPTPGEKEDVTVIFDDVKAGKWYVNAVQYVYDNDLMSGNEGFFKPTENITRAQLVTTLYRLAGSPEVTDRSALDDFTDVKDQKYYTDALCWAYAAGIATGSNGAFNPTGLLTRQQMAAFFYRYADHQGMDISVKGNIDDMVNAEQVSSYAKDAIEWAVGTGLISGSEVVINGNKVKDLNPKGYTTRAQVATILMRFCENN